MSHKTFPQVWKFVESLTGTTVMTLDRGISNRIIAVTSKGVLRESAGSKQNRQTVVPRQTFEKIWSELVQNGKCVAVEKKVWRIACAILTKLPEVTYTTRPLTLYLKR